MNNINERNYNSQQTKDEKDYGKLREYLKELLEKVYNSREIRADEASALAALGAGLETLLLEAEKGKMNAAPFIKTLERILIDSGWDNESSEVGENADRREYMGSQKLMTEEGKVVYLGEILGSGGEGTIYKIPAMPGTVAKLYHISADLQEKERHVKALIHNQIPSEINHVLISPIPEQLLYNENGQFTGYLMAQMSSQIKIYSVQRASYSRNRFFPEMDYRWLIAIAYNLAEAVDNLHRYDVIIGDMNPNNIAVNRNGTVCLLDADSFDIVDKKTGEHFPCAVGLPELLAPELQTAGNLRKAVFTKETDYFSLAIHIFRLLMNNADPFGTICLEKAESMGEISYNRALINGECPYVRDLPGKEIPGWVPPFGMLPDDIRGLFDRVFNYTVANYKDRIKQRPSAREWMDALIKFYNMPMRQCLKEPFHWYREGLDECPFCAGKITATK